MPNPLSMPGDTWRHRPKTQEDLHLPGVQSSTESQQGQKTRHKNAPENECWVSLGHRARQPHSIHCSPALSGCWLGYRLLPPMTVSTNISQVPTQGAKGWGAKKWIQSIPLPLRRGGQFQSSLQPASLAPLPSGPQSLNPQGRKGWALAALRPRSRNRRGCFSWAVGTGQHLCSAHKWRGLAPAPSNPGAGGRKAGIYHHTENRTTWPGDRAGRETGHSFPAVSFFFKS